MSKIRDMFVKGVFTVKKYSPEILLGAGLVGGVAATVMACIATPKIDGILEDSKTKIDAVHKYKENPELVKEIENCRVQEYTEQDAQKDLVIIYAKTAWELLKIYGPSLIVGTVSIAAILASHNILRKREVAAALALTSMTKAFSDYRQNVIESYGEEEDQRLRHGIKAVEVTQAKEGGGEESKTIEVVDKDSPFVFYYSKDTVGEDFVAESMDYNMAMLSRYEEYLNDKLVVNKWISLNQVLEYIGMEPTKEGMVIGWVYDTENPVGDNYIDFRKKPVWIETTTGLEEAILLDFNVDGNIYHRL